MGLSTSLPNAVVQPGVCTSATRPASPYRGQTIYETNTGRLLVYYGATTGWQPPWGQPWGFMNGIALPTSFTQSSTSTFDVTGMSVTFTATNNRFYKISAFMPAIERVSGVATAFCLFNGASELQLCVVDGSSPGTFNVVAPAHLVKTQTFTAGLTTLKCSIRSVGGSGTMSAHARGGNPTLLVEDIGPSTTFAPTS